MPHFPKRYNYLPFVLAFAWSGCAKPNKYEPIADQIAPGAHPPGDSGPGSVTPGGSQSIDAASANGLGGPGGVFTCSPGSPCQLPSKPCLVGATLCEGGRATCSETTTLQANGSACGGDS